MPSAWASLSATDAGALVLDGARLSQLGGDALLRHARAAGLPRSLSDEQQIRVILGALLQCHGGTVPKDAWSEVREEAGGLLLLAVRRDGCLSASTAAALTVLNKPQVVEKYTMKGNRWTMAEACRDPAVAQARKELGGEGPGSTGEWLRSLADALDAPTDERPWYTSKMVLIILLLAAIFVLVHVALLWRVLAKASHAGEETALRRRPTARLTARLCRPSSRSPLSRRSLAQVHATDSRVLLYPIAGLSASAVVGAFAIGVHRLSEPSKKKA